MAEDEFGPREVTAEDLELAAELDDERRVRDGEEARGDPDVVAANRRKRKLPKPDKLKDLANAVVAHVAVQVLSNEIKVTPANARAIAECFHNIARLESGQPTSIKSMGKEDTINAIKALRDQARRDLKAVPDVG